jgi:rhodanese-related sulfurtransferase
MTGESMKNNSFFSATTGLLCLICIVATASLIYLTPLKWVNLVEPHINDIEPAEFYAKYKGNEDQYVFIDVRSQDAYDRVHAAGSALMPLHTLYDERHNLPLSGKKIVLICSGGRASGVGYSYLEHYGFFNIERIAGGIEAWQLANLPVESNL